MANESKKGRIWCLLLLSLFLMEYLEPSAIGVRAWVAVPLTQGNPDRENPPTPHAMVFNTPLQIDARLTIAFFIPVPVISSPQAVYFKIERPPLSPLAVPHSV
ncbi:MAG: hypothetical protein HY892_14890 [Deltaproteobacteria bacterium]|nr:hypothetical protein [Deltaproteobacteria bacterium]